MHTQTHIYINNNEGMQGYSRDEYVCGLAVSVGFTGWFHHQ